VDDVQLVHGSEGSKDLLADELQPRKSEVARIVLIGMVQILLEQLG
jgi:hypothetical protein